MKCKYCERVLPDKAQWKIHKHLDHGKKIPKLRLPWHEAPKDAP